MRRRPLTTLSLVALLSLSAATTSANGPLPMVSPEAQGFSSERLDRVRDVAERYVEEGRVAGLITMVARRGEVVQFEAVGTRGVGDDRPLEKDALYRIYSMTKPITAAAAMQLYERGLFHLDDPVSKFVPEFDELEVLLEDGSRVPAEREMTMQHLLTHTAGFSYGFNPQGDPVDAEYVKANLWGAEDLDDLAAKVAKLPLKFEPGDRWHYSIAVDITGLVVQRLSGQPFDEYLKEHIFEPLGMNDTFFEVPPEKLDRFLPNHYIDPADGEMKQTPTNGSQAMSNYAKVSLYSGGGGLVSSTADYMRFAEAMRNGGKLGDARILGPKTIEFMTANHLPASISSGGSGEAPVLGGELNGFGFGLGFGLVTDPAAGGVIGSAGEYNWGGAAGTVFWIDPVEEVVVVGMIQLMGSPHPLRGDLKVATYQALDETLSE